MKTEKIVKFRSAKDLQEAIDAYFNACKEEDEPVTITGLALALNVSRETLRDYNENDVFFSVIKKAKLRVQHAYEKRLIKRGNTGDIFALKTFGWSDKQDLNKTFDVKTALVEFSDFKPQSADETEEKIEKEYGFDGRCENTDEI